jgi:hypothetical protein
MRWRRADAPNKTAPALGAGALGPSVYRVGLLRIPSGNAQLLLVFPDLCRNP